MSERLLVVFVKNLIPGMVKTRLAEDIGIDRALDVYMELVRLTHTAALKVKAEKMVLYSEYVEIEDIWDDGTFRLGVQKGDGLGQKMSNAFDEAFDSFQKVVLVGSDCHEISTKIINDAFDHLEENDVVVGPAKDGGYYLLGMSDYYQQFFENKTYSHHQVFKELTDTAEKLGISIHQLPSLRDIDTFEDLKESGIDWESLGENEDYMPNDFDPDLEAH